MLTEQNRQARVHTSPMSIIVAVPALQHSLMFGHFASSQTVANRCCFTMSFTDSYFGEWRTRIFKKSGFFRRVASDFPVLMPSLIAWIPEGVTNFSPLATLTAGIKFDSTFSTMFWQLRPTTHFTCEVYTNVALNYCPKKCAVAEP